MLQHSIRLRAFGFWGVPSVSPLSWNISASGAFAQARRRAPGSVSGLRCFDVEESEKDVKRGSGNADEHGARPLVLDYRLKFPFQFNKKANWAVSFSSAPATNALAALEEYSSPFGGHVQGLGYTNNHEDAVAEFSAPAGLIPLDTGWAVSVYLVQPPELQKVPVHTQRWGNPDPANAQNGAGWMLRAEKARFSLVRLAAKSEADDKTGAIDSPGWNPTDEDALNELLELADNDDASDEQRDAARDQAAEKRARIYAEEWSLGGGEGFGRVVELVLIPEGRALTVTLDGKPTKIAPSYTPEELADMEDGAPQLWPEGILQVRTNGGAWIARFGFPQFVSEGILPLPLPRFASADDVSDVVTNFLGVTPPGTTLSIERVHPKARNGIDELVSVDLVAKLRTTNRRQTPVAHLLSVYLPGSARNGSNAKVWDSGEITASLSTPGDEQPVMDVVPRFDGEGRRRQYEIYVRDVGGRTFKGLGRNYELLEHRTATLEIDGAPVCTHGIITDARWADVNAFTPGWVRQLIASGESVVQLTLCDVWCVLEERLTHDEVGDGMRAGAYLRLCLAAVGAWSSELAGISANSGPFLRPARPGEQFRVRPNAGTYYADWLREFMAKYCPGWVLYQDRLGVWRFERRPMAVKATFSSNPGAHSALTYPGRLAMWNREMVRDASDFYNRHTASGQDENGVPFSLWWNIHESYTGQAGPVPSKTWLGRVKEAQPLDMTGCTVNEARLTLRLGVQAQGAPRFLNFDTYFHTPGLGFDFFPGDFVRCDGVLGRVARIGSGSLLEDEMQISVQEM